jgi:hypothetical protein
MVRTSPVTVIGTKMMNRNKVTHATACGPLAAVYTRRAPARSVQSPPLDGNVGASCLDAHHTQPAIAIRETIAPTIVRCDSPALAGGVGLFFLHRGRRAMLDLSQFHDRDRDGKRCGSLPRDVRAASR